jgi:hypothetical protein
VANSVFTLSTKTPYLRLKEDSFKELMPFISIQSRLFYSWLKNIESLSLLIRDHWLELEFPNLKRETYYTSNSFTLSKTKTATSFTLPELRLCNDGSHHSTSSYTDSNGRGWSIYWNNSRHMWSTVNSGGSTISTSVYVTDIGTGTVDEVKDNYGHLPKSVAMLFEKKRLELLINDPMLESFKEIRTGNEIIFSKEFSQTLDGLKLFEMYSSISKDIKVLYRNERIITQIPKGNDALSMSIEVIQSAKKCTK